MTTKTIVEYETQEIEHERLQCDQCGGISDGETEDEWRRFARLPGDAAVQNLPSGYRAISKQYLVVDFCPGCVDEMAGKVGWNAGETITGRASRPFAEIGAQLREYRFDMYLAGGILMFIPAVAIALGVMIVGNAVAGVNQPVGGEWLTLTAAVLAATVAFVIGTVVGPPEEYK